MSDSEQREADRQELPSIPAGKGFQREFEMSFGSNIEFLDLVQDISLSITRMAGFDDEASHWICLSVRESVTNAIYHGNRLDESKRVGVRFRIDRHQLLITVSDQGNGFEPDLPAGSSGRQESVETFGTWGFLRPYVHGRRDLSIPPARRVRSQNGKATYTH